MLIKQLMSLREGAIKNQMYDLVEKAMKEVDVSGMAYKDALAKLAKYIISQDNSEFFGGRVQDAIEFISGVYSQKEHLTINEEEEESEFPKKIAKAGDFVVELDEQEQVRILDTSGSTKLQMPLVIWKQLTRQ